MVDKVCRLCLGTENLLWIFDEKMGDNMPEIIETTSGVQISKTDTVTQLVCSACCQITIKMFKFRTTSIKNDKDLKAKCAGYHISKLTNAAHNNVKNDVKKEPPPVKYQIPNKYKNAHPSIKEIIKKYPNVKLPEISLNSHLGAYITLLTDEVDEWYKERNLSDEEIEKIKRKALEYASEAPQQNSPNLQQRRKRRKISADDKTPPNNRKLSTDKQTPSNSASKKIKINDETPAKAKSLSSNAEVKLTESNISKPNENIPPKIDTKIQSTKIDTTVQPPKVDAKIQSAAKADKAVAKDAKQKTTPNSIKINPVSKSAFLQSTDTVIKLNKKASPEPVAQLKMGSVLGSMLNKNNNSKTSNTEITLKSLLAEINEPEKSAKSTAANENSNTGKTNVDTSDNDAFDAPMVHSDSDATDIEIEDRGSSENDSDKLQQQKSSSGPYMFTTTPFVRNAEKKERKKSKRRHIFVISDSEEDDNSGNNSAKKNSSVDTQNAEDSNTDQSKTERNESVIKSAGESSNMSDFVKYLELAPNNTTNTPDLSLVSVTQKTNTLYACSVCDSHHNSVKELKVHLRRMHTKCPFCGKRFRTLSNREEHIKNDCPGNKARFNLKKPKLSLVRVDEVEEIRKQYPDAFRVLQKDNVVDETSKEISPPRGQSNQSSPVPPVSTSEPPRVSSPPKQIEKTCSESSPSVVAATTAPTLATTAGSQNVSLETSSTELPPTAQSQLQSDTNGTKESKNSGRQEKYDNETADAVRELEKFLEDVPSTERTEKSDMPSAQVASHIKETTTSGSDGISNDVICISDDEEEAPNASKANNCGKSNSPSIKIINNELLKNINLHDNDVQILRNILSKAAESKYVINDKTNRIKEHTIVDGGTARIKVFKDLRKQLQYYKIPVEIAYNEVLNVDYKKVKPKPHKSVKDLWYKLIPTDLKMPNTNNNNTNNFLHPGATSTFSTPKKVPIASSTVNTYSRNTPVIVQSHTSNVSTNLVPNVTTLNRETVPLPSNIILTSPSPLVNPPQMQKTFVSNAPVYINNTPNAYTPSTTGTSYANIIIVPTSLVTTTANIAVTTLPATQGPLPVIQSIQSPESASISTAQPGSVSSSTTQSASSASTSALPGFASSSFVQTASCSNNSAQSVSLANNPVVTHPTIRVRNLSELS